MKAHKGLTSEKWNSYSFFMQMANVAMDIERTIEWRKAGNKEYSDMAFERALELLDLTKIDPKNRGARRKELFRLREVCADYFWGDNEYQSSDELWHDYFYGFCYAAALERGR